MIQKKWYHFLHEVFLEYVFLRVFMFVLPNFRDDPRGGCAQAVFADYKAGWDGEAVPGIAGPVPALRSGDWLAFPLFISRIF